MFRLYKVPEPDSGVESFEKAETRSVLIGPAPGRTFPDTFQLTAVSPAFCTGSLWKVTTLSSKVKSPWNPTSLFAASMAVVVTCAVKLVTDASTAPLGSETAATVAGSSPSPAASAPGPPAGR